jgi:hypothetical protein
MKQKALLHREQKKVRIQKRKERRKKESRYFVGRQYESRFKADI